MRYLKLIIFSIIFIVSYNCKSNPYQIKESNIEVTVVDHSTQKPIAVRVRITDSNGHVPGLPEEAISVMYGRNDEPERYGYQPDSSFYVDSHFKLNLKPGKYNIFLSKGIEYVDQTQNIEVKVGQANKLKFEMKRWVNMSDHGWYSADEHIHIRRSPRENPLISKWVEAEGLDVGILLQMGDFWTTYFSQYAFGDDGVYKTDKSLLSSGQEEPRTPQLGHTIALGADDFVRYSSNYYYYDKVFDKIHELNGIMGYAHQGVSFNGATGMTLDVLAGKVDFLELLQFCVEGGPLLTQNYYHYLDLGFKLTATAGSDFPWCGNGPLFGTDSPKWNARIGNVRFYTHVNGKFEYPAWKESLKSGHTFVSSGPMVLFSIDGKLPGDEIKLSKPGKITINAKALGNKDQIPLSKLEIIAHGKVLKQVIPDGVDQTLENLEVNFDLDVEKGIWIAVRCYAGPNQVAHTTPIYITVNNDGFQNPETFRSYLALNEKNLDELEKELKERNKDVEKRAWWYKAGLKRRIDYTRKIIKLLKKSK